MARRCELTGKGVMSGHLVSHANNKRKRVFRPNLQTVTLASDTKRTRTYATKGLRARQHDGIGALWAVDRLHDLAARNRPDSELIIALARRYSIETAALPAE